MRPLLRLLLPVPSRVRPGPLLLLLLLPGWLAGGRGPVHLFLL